MPEDKNKEENFKLSMQDKLSVDSLYRWSKFVSISTIVLGSITFLSIFFLAIPTAIIGIVTIVMGVKLNIASNHLRYAVQVNSKESIFIAADHLRQYFTFNGIIIIISMIFLIITAIIFVLFAGAIIDIFNQSGFDYNISI
ncbi:MAG: hypothetical protein CBD04_004025 [bacterium TMED144]|nr:MAG: hypothetical protein CBD04_004025 [bacterium TMED144]|tara:strand:- start:3248 stop:3670 length:423 start_codon:yes stop_codon:yes gene_type:complete